MDRHETADDGTVVNRDMPRHLHTIGDDHIVADDAVMRDVHVRHEKTARSYRRLAGRGAAAVDRAVFPDDRAVADLDPRLLALVFQVLRIVADDRAIPDLHALADACVPLEDGVGRDAAALAHGNVRADHAVRPHGHVGAKLGGRIDERRPVDHLSTTIAIISASATTCPSTNPAPFILQVLPRNWSMSSSKRIWSPGTTGRRNFTWSSDMKYTTLFAVSCPSKWVINSIPPTCAIASMISTPGIIG